MHVKLVHPTACIKAYDFITDENLAPLAAPLKVGVNPKGKLSSQPGQLSDNILIVNTCSLPHSFNLEAVLDSDFRL